MKRSYILFIFIFVLELRFGRFEPNKENPPDSDLEEKALAAKIFVSETIQPLAGEIVQLSKDLSDIEDQINSNIAGGLNSKRNYGKNYTLIKENWIAANSPQSSEQTTSRSFQNYIRKKKMTKEQFLQHTSNGLVKFQSVKEKIFKYHADITQVVDNFKNVYDILNGKQEGPFSNINRILKTKRMKILDLKSKLSLLNEDVQEAEDNLADIIDLADTWNKTIACGERVHEYLTAVFDTTQTILENKTVKKIVGKLFKNAKLSQNLSRKWAKLRKSGKVHIIAMIIIEIIIALAKIIEGLIRGDTWQAIFFSIVADSPFFEVLFAQVRVAQATVQIAGLITFGGKLRGINQQMTEVLKKMMNGENYEEEFKEFLKLAREAKSTSICKRITIPQSDPILYIPDIH